MTVIRRQAGLRLAVTATMLVAVCGCISPGERARLVQRNEALRRDNERLKRTVGQRDGTLARLHEQIRNLKGFEADRPADLFAPVRVEIASLSGGADYDSVPGDDGVNVYVRPRDADGDVVKAPGRISIQLLDNTDLRSPRVIGVYVFDEPERLRLAWHGKFGTRHYTLKCPFPSGVTLPKAGRLDVKVEFVDYLTGATLTANQEVTISLPNT